MPAIHRPLLTADAVRGAFGSAPVAVSALAALGLSRGRVRAAVSAGTLVVVRRGVVQAPPWGADGIAEDDGRPTSISGSARQAHLDQARAALLLLKDDTVVSHASAAFVQEVPTFERAPTDVWVTAPRHGRVVAGTHRRRGTVEVRDRAVLDGVPCTTVARTALDLARRRPLHQALVPLDAALARVGPKELRAAMARLEWIYDLSSLSTALDAASPISESPLESISRGRILAAGLPAPCLQQWIEVHDGAHYRVDFLWPDEQVIGEADGLVKYATIDDVRAEKRREDALRASGFTVVRWTYQDMTTDPAPTLARLRTALGR